ncbi:chemotaxis protein CheW, partial [Candidatus Accumulibacter phosphatis]
RLVENIRDSALQLRMVPIGETFNRFQRVVRDNARELGKTIDLAIIDGFLTGVGPASYVVPLDSVVECIELGEVSASRNYLNLCGEVLPFVRLRELFGIGGEIPDRQNVVIVQYAGEKAGLVVDTLLGEFQTVIKPLGVLFKHLRGIGGSTILGTGEVALILDVPALVGLVTRLEDRRLTAPPAAERLAAY